MQISHVHQNTESGMKIRVAWPISIHFLKDSKEQAVHPIKRGENIVVILNISEAIDNFLLHGVHQFCTLRHRRTTG